MSFAAYRYFIYVYLIFIFYPSLVWHKIYFPYVPPLPTLRHQVTQCDTSNKSPTTLLFALLCLIALDVPAKGLAPYRHLRPTLQGIVYAYGQAELFDPSEHRYTIIAFELMAEYRQLALVTDHHVAGRSVKGQLYIALAKQVALRLGLNDAGSQIRDRLAASDNGIEQLIYDCLQWSKLTMAEMELNGYTGRRQPDHSMRMSLDTLRTAMAFGHLSPRLAFLFHRITAFVNETQAFYDMAKGWRSLDRIADLTDMYVLRFCPLVIVHVRE